MPMGLQRGDGSQIHLSPSINNIFISLLNYLIMASEFIDRQKHDILRDISALGSLIFYLLLLLITIVLEKYDLFFKMIAGLVLIYIAAVFIRTVHFKERPNKFSHNSYIERLDASSFPSLHASRTAFLGVVLMKYFGS